MHQKCKTDIHFCIIRPKRKKNILQSEQNSSCMPYICPDKARSSPSEVDSGSTVTSVMKGTCSIMRVPECLFTGNSPKAVNNGSTHGNLGKCLSDATPSPPYVAPHRALHSNEEPTGPTRGIRKQIALTQCLKANTPKTWPHPAHSDHRNTNGMQQGQHGTFERKLSLSQSAADAISRHQRVIQPNGVHSK